MKENNLLVTLADKNYVEQAKQLFSSVYWNAGWKGDYMLLSHEIPEKDLKWFREKGILIKKVKPLIREKTIGPLDYSSTVMSKLYPFTPYFKKWKKIIFLDSDIIVRDNFDELLNVKTLGSVNTLKLSLHTYFDHSKDHSQYKELKKNFNLKEKVFNSGVMSINTKIITKNTLKDILRLYKKYKKIIVSDDDLLNLYFYKQWKEFPEVYDIMIPRIHHFYRIPYKKIKGIIIHFGMGKKPWEKDHPLNEEWERYYKQSKRINLKDIPPPKNKWNERKINDYCKYLNKKRFMNSWKIHIDRYLGILGIKIKRFSPKIYLKLKKIRVFIWNE